MLYESAAADDTPSLVQTTSHIGVKESCDVNSSFEEFADILVPERTLREASNSLRRLLDADLDLLS